MNGPANSTTERSLRRSGARPASGMPAEQRVEPAGLTGQPGRYRYDGRLRTGGQVLG